MIGSSTFNLLIGESIHVCIRALQGLEAEFVIYNVAAGALLLPTKPLVLTLHDCIICGEGETGLIEGEFERAFNEQNFRMALKSEIF